MDKASFNMATLRFKNFKDYKLAGVDFTEADLTGSDFTGATFDNCHLHSVVSDGETKFDKTDLRGAYLANPPLGRVSLRGAMVTTEQAEFLLFEKYGLLVIDH